MEVPRFGGDCAEVRPRARVPGVSGNFSLGSSAEKSAGEAHLPPSGRMIAASMKWSAFKRREVGAGWRHTWPILALVMFRQRGAAAGCLGVPALSAAWRRSSVQCSAIRVKRGTYDYDSTTRPTVERASAGVGRIGKHPVRLLVCNDPLPWKCGMCGAPATLVCGAHASADSPFACGAHEATRVRRRIVLACRLQ